MKQNKVRRHSPLVMINHWLIAISGLILLFTGFGQLPMYKRYNVIKVPGLEWSANFELNFLIHLIVAIVFGGAVLYHIIYHYQQKEFAAVPIKGDVKESIHIIKAMITGGEEPPQGKFLAEQRLAYAAIGITSIVLILTGLVKILKNFHSVTLNPTLNEINTLIHTAFGMIFLLLFFSHMGAFIIKANWPLFFTMFTGKVNKEYAEKRHSLWNFKR
jgi:cytochrome b subunit of formate dehydrogenase